MTPTISIIMPVYNAEKWLPRCFDSILAQDVKDFEVITVNDCSTDNSLNIIQKYCDKDKRFVCINKHQNEGVDKAREDGLKKATGEFILFMDSDDTYEPHLFDKLIKVFSNHPHLNIVEFKFNQMIDGIKYPADYLVRKNPNNIYQIKDENILLATALWNKCYRTHFIKQYHLSGMPTRCQAGGEIPFHICSFLLAQEIYFLDFYGYNWYLNTTSLSHNKAKDKLFLTDTWKVLDFLKAELIRLNLYNEKEYHQYCTTILNWYLDEKFSLHYFFYEYYTTCKKLFKNWETKKLPPYGLFMWKKFRRKIKKVLFNKSK